MGAWRNYRIRRYNHCNIIYLVIIWTTLQHTVVIETIETQENNKTIARTFGHLNDNDELIQKHYEDVQKREMSYYDQSWTPKLKSSTSVDYPLNIHLNGGNPNSKYYTDVTDKEYDNYGVNSDDYYTTHDHAPHQTILIKPPPETLLSKLTSLLSIDALKILILLVLKLLLIKLKTITFMKFLILLLIKLPMIVAAFVLKLFFFVKLTNFFKIITLPLFLPILLLILGPLVLILPLIILPFLLPLLLFLPIPILTFTTTSTTTTTAATTGKRKRRRRYLDSSDINLDIQSTNQQVGRKYGSRYSDLLYFKYMIESEQCLERIACKLAADKKSGAFKSYIARILDVTKEYLMNPRLHSYVSAYKIGAVFNTTFAKCEQYYLCSKFKT